MHIPHGVTAVAIGAALVAGFALNQFAQADDMTTFTITTDTGVEESIDIGPDGISVGDVLVFTANFTTEDGTPGTINGYHVATDLTDPDDPLANMVSTIVFEFGGDDSIVVAQSSTGTFQGDSMVDWTAGGQQLRAIIGGTGKFIGAKGQVIGKQNADGSWSQEFLLVD